ncbi:hypothetical protein MB27_41925 [Actinoplanes utahensis]|uniref:Uncharacterized protein n=1 Tax=Actinoplanes utahensis TaxID=1869 RepID=A0A0A6U824_ACTUT|nr:hypothetical protein MB27_41925 [Actinoplanes utahensis]
MSTGPVSPSSAPRADPTWTGIVGHPPVPIRAPLGATVPAWFVPGPGFTAGVSRVAFDGHPPAPVGVPPASTVSGRLASGRVAGAAC